ncbi:MAG: hypothetical protein B6229_01980 [Spirochaetaceae bacterium 4572_7]|nr:MAG: hypothetical protein B6229_01980 [Spirochaetaceae bacterium 4572_7]
MNCKLIFLIPLVLFLSCSPNDFVNLQIGESILRTEIADSDAQRTKGLMNRNSLNADSGMIFVFEKEQRVTFWMKNTSIPLSIAYISKDGKILDIYDMVPYSLEGISSRRSSVLYALEVNKGYFKSRDIKVNNKIDLTPLLSYLKSSN